MTPKELISTLKQLQYYSFDGALARSDHPYLKLHNELPRIIRLLEAGEELKDKAEYVLGGNAGGVHLISDDYGEYAERLAAALSAYEEAGK